MVFVDDSDVCVAGARDVGIHAVRYQSNAQAIAEIEKLLTSPKLRDHEAMNLLYDLGECTDS
jgi:hypothetical protein